jgi:hypothetical protein
MENVYFRQILLPRLDFIIIIIIIIIIITIIIIRAPTRNFVFYSIINSLL